MDQPGSYCVPWPWTSSCKIGHCPRRDKCWAFGRALVSSFIHSRHGLFLVLDCESIFFPGKYTRGRTGPSNEKGFQVDGIRSDGNDTVDMIYWSTHSILFLTYSCSTARHPLLFPWSVSGGFLIWMGNIPFIMLTISACVYISSRCMGDTWSCSCCGRHGLNFLSYYLDTFSYN